MRSTLPDEPEQYPEDHPGVVLYNPERFGSITHTAGGVHIHFMLKWVPIALTLLEKLFSYRCERVGRTS